MSSLCALLFPSSHVSFHRSTHIGSAGQDYKYWTYAQFAEKVSQAGSAMQALGLDKTTKFNIYASTSPKWQLVANACASQSITFCTSYDSLGEEGLKHSLNEPEVVGIFTNADLLRTLYNALPDTPTVRVVVYDGEIPQKDKELVDKIKAVRDNIQIMSLDELLQKGKENPKEPVKPEPEDVLCIMYTYVFLATAPAAVPGTTPVLRFAHVI